MSEVTVIGIGSRQTCLSLTCPGSQRARTLAQEGNPQAVAHSDEQLPAPHAGHGGLRGLSLPCTKVTDAWSRRQANCATIREAHCDKNDFVDAEAICEAAARPAMRFVTPKTEAQQTLAALLNALAPS